MSQGEYQSRFQSLLVEHKGILYKICNSYCRNRDDREDLAQEIAIQLWRSFGSFDGRCRFPTWMYRIALNVAISFYRRESTRNHYVFSGGDRLLEVVDEAASQSPEVAFLCQYIERLDPFHKALLLLYLDGHSHQEIAAVLGISETNVATKIGRLKQAMKQEQYGTR
jgi:RNA polymerase sigma factor (sigma-70 family)